MVTTNSGMAVFREEKNRKTFLAAEVSIFLIMPDHTTSAASLMPSGAGSILH
jgi:hypothetical protein